MGDIITITAAAEHDGLRLDGFLAAQLDGQSRSAIAKAIASGNVTSQSGKTVKKNHIVRGGDVFLCTLDQPVELHAIPQDIPLEIAFEDEQMLVVDKPRGLVVHPAPGHPDGTLVNGLLHYLKGKIETVGDINRPGIVHRLDKDTSGLLLIAKTEKAHHALSDQLRARTVSRIYHAIVIGRPRESSGTIDLPIGRHPSDRKRMSVHAKVSRPAVTHYKTLGEYPGYAHLECRLETGRTHQIRVHLTQLGHPILGDLTYGQKRAALGLSGQCLHAKTLAFDHPTTGERVEVDSELPGYFQRTLKTIDNSM